MEIICVIHPKCYMEKQNKNERNGLLAWVVNYLKIEYNSSFFVTAKANLKVIFKCMFIPYCGSNLQSFGCGTHPFITYIEG